jgi:SAM-dependent methyltransferase
MPIGYFRALRILHKSFAHYPAEARAHMLVRFFTCPFLRTLDLVPQKGRLLDIGAGHGLFPRLAIEEKELTVYAVEPDLRKTFLPFRDRRVKFIAGFDSCVRGSFDTVTIYDATYRIPLDERDALYRRAFERLKPGGLFILKDMNADRKVKMKWARFQEFVSDRLLGISIGEGFIYESPAAIRARLEAIGFVDFRARDIDFGYPHPHAVFTARKPA